MSGQLRGEFEVREANIHKYVEKAKEMAAQLEQFEIQAILRADNIKADALSNLASSDLFSIERNVMVHILKEKSITEKTVTVNNLNQQEEWFSELVEYKLTGTLSMDQMSENKLKRQAS